MEDRSSCASRSSVAPRWAWPSVHASSSRRRCPAAAAIGLCLIGVVLDPGGADGGAGGDRRAEQQQQPIQPQAVTTVAEVEPVELPPVATVANRTPAMPVRSPQQLAAPAIPSVFRSLELARAEERRAANASRPCDRGARRSSIASSSSVSTLSGARRDRWFGAVDVRPPSATRLGDLRRGRLARAPDAELADLVQNRLVADARGARPPRACCRRCGAA